MTTLLQRRLPGIRIETPAPALRESLPRMDIALFVGFAASGPLDLPVAVESLNEFEVVFGERIALAKDADTGETVHGHLHAGVRSFFGNGGRRCWVVRVASDRARTNVYPLAKLLAATRSGSESWRYEPAVLRARCPGSWSDGVEVDVRVRGDLVSLYPDGEYAAGLLALDAAGPTALGLELDDVVRFTLLGSRVHGRIVALEAVRRYTDGTSRRRLTLDALTSLSCMSVDSPGATPVALAYRRLDDDGAALVEEEIAAQGAWGDEGTLTLTAQFPVAHVPAAGSVLRIAFDGGPDDAWLAVDEADLLEIAGETGEVQVRMSGRPWLLDGADCESALEAWIATGTALTGERLRLDLSTTDGSESAFALEKIALSGSQDSDAEAGLNIATLVEDSTFFVPTNAVQPQGAVARAFELATRDPQGRLTGRFPLASPGLAGELMLLPLGDITEFEQPQRAAIATLPALQRDGLDEYSWRLFAETLLAQESCDAIADRAEALRLLASTPRSLRGMHAAFGSAAVAVADEPTLLAIPDAVHNGWDPAIDELPAWTELPQAPAAIEPVDPELLFYDCAATPLPTPRFVRAADPDADGDFVLQWTEVDVGATYELEEATASDFAAAVVVHSGTAPSYAVLGKKPGSQFYRVRASAGPRVSAWSPAVEVRVGETGYRTRAWSDENLLALHRLMLRVAAGRGDMLAVLGLPEHYDWIEAIVHAATLRDSTPSSASEVAPIGADEERALSHGALYHPWPLAQRVDETIAAPPDGAILGQMAAGALARGPWIAVANQPLRDVVALSDYATTDERQALLDAQVNVVRSAPHGFVPATADTLSTDPDWRPVNVRRLMTLLRRLALRRGANYVFEPNGETLKRTVERGFEAVLDELFRRGAFAGANPDAAYRVDVGEDVNTRRRNDLGQFWVELKVAPSLPLTFMTVRLSRSGERLIAYEAR